jgi:ferredoxin
MAEGDRVSIDRSSCFQSGECVLAAPEVYEFDDDGYPVASESGVAQAPTSLLLQTEETCPSRAIRVTSGGE